MTKLLNSLAERGTGQANPGGNGGGVADALRSLLSGGGSNDPTTTLPAETEKQSTALWTMIHIIFSILAGAWLLVVLHTATKDFGNDPPPPPTIKDPFLVFVLGELIMMGGRSILQPTDSTARAGSGSSLRYVTRLGGIVKQICRDGSIVLFMLGAANWRNGTAR